MAIQHKLHSASLEGFDKEVARLQGDPHAMLAAVGISRAQLLDRTCLIGLNSIIRLLALAAETLACPNFGMRVAGHHGVRMLGVLGKLIAAEPDLGSAFEASQRYMTLHHTAEHWRMERHNGRVYIRRIEHFNSLTHAQQYREMTLCGYARLVLELGGADARPLRVEISHRAIAPARTYQRHFGCEVFFNQERDCLVFDSKLLSRRVQPISSVTESFIDEYLRSHRANLQEQLELQVRSLIAQTLGLHQHSLDNVASLLGLHPRTLQRRLQAEGLSFKELLQDVKLQTACWHLHASSIELTRLAHALGYQELAAFSKAFRSRYGVSPSQWRARARSDPSDPPA